MKPLLLSTQLLAGVLLLWGCSGSEPEFAEGPVPERIDFNVHVRGLLSDTCFACHGPDALTREAGFRIDTREGALALLSDGKSHGIVPGDPQASEVYRRIVSHDPDYVMPTPSSNLSLGERDIAILRRWIEQGAEYKEHWAFVPPERPEVPQVRNQSWSDDPVDHFILQKLEEQGLSPSPPASRETWLRRVSFDLTGLPPTPDHLADFLADDTPQAYERVVDRLLASEAYGERMTMEWLDVARYADSHGYQDDGPNEMWPWREWVINAFNANMPFDDFITWQMAGDLLPEATRDQILATGFHRVHQQTQEGGVIGEEFRVEYVADRVYTTATAFLGVTMQCARCHDHKYDPVSEVEYYEFAAFFDNVNDAGQIPYYGAAGPTLLLPDEQTEQKLAWFEQSIAAQEQELQAAKQAAQTAFRRWMQQTGTGYEPVVSAEGLVAYIPLDGVQGDSVLVHTPSGTRSGRVSGSPLPIQSEWGPGLEFAHGHYIECGRLANFERNEPFSLAFRFRTADTYAEIPILVNMCGIAAGYRGYDVSLQNNRLSMRLVHGWPFNAIQVLSTREFLPGEWYQVVLSYDGSSNAGGIRLYVDGSEQPLHIEHNTLYKHISPANYSGWCGGQNVQIGHRNSQEGLSYRGLGLRDLYIYGRQLSSLEARTLSRESLTEPRLFSHVADRGPVSVAHVTASERASAQADLPNPQALFEHYLLHYDADYRAVLQALEQLRGEKLSVQDTLREVMVMGERLNPRQSYVRERGMYDQLGQKVWPDVPSAILPFPDEFPRNRVGLARWFLHDEHPLTSRVLVNRYWQMLFGQGLVRTPEDFGNQGMLPTHPELLDWLAVEFREGGWDLKALMRQLVLSQTYRQSSVLTAELREKDPQNLWLARANRQRLQAEMIRDNALVASGLLVHKVGGPSVFPYQPEGIWEETTSGRNLTTYVQDTGESLYRRSLYTFWKRSTPPPGMTTFDMAMRSHPTAKRQQTSTPLQALNLMNDPQYVEASRVLAERMMRYGGQTLEEQIVWAFVATATRLPEEREIEVLTRLYELEYEGFSDDPERAGALLGVGEYPADPDLPAVEVAARSMVAITLLNLDETITRQ